MSPSCSGLRIWVKGVHKGLLLLLLLLVWYTAGMVMLLSLVVQQRLDVLLPQLLHLLVCSLLCHRCC